MRTYRMYGEKTPSFLTNSPSMCWMPLQALSNQWWVERMCVLPSRTFNLVAEGRNHASKQIPNSNNVLWRKQERGIWFIRMGRKDLAPEVASKSKWKNEWKPWSKGQEMGSWQGNSMCKGPECSRNGLIYASSYPRTASWEASCSL